MLNGQVVIILFHVFILYYIFFFFFLICVQSSKILHLVNTFKFKKKNIYKFNVENKICDTSIKNDIA